MSKVMLLHYITILCKTTWGNLVQVPSGRTFRHSAPCLWHLQSSINCKLIFLLMRSLLRHPMVHPYDMISEHTLGDREWCRGPNCPSLWFQPVSVTVGRTGEGTWACNQTQMFWRASFHQQIRTSHFVIVSEQQHKDIGIAYVHNHWFHMSMNTVQN